MPDQVKSPKTTQFDNEYHSSIFKGAINFIIAAGGIYFFYLYYGIMQEYIFSHNYAVSTTPSSPPAKFTFSSILVLFQALITYLLSSLLSLILRPSSSSSSTDSPLLPPPSLMMKLKLGLFNTISMLGSNTALSFVSYPVQALMKSCKIISVMLVAFVIGGKKFKRYEVFSASIITVGILVFNLMGKSKSSSNSSSLLGIVLLLVSLFSDGMLADTQHTMTHIYKSQLSTYDIMANTNLFCWILTLCYSFLTGQLKEFLVFTELHPSVWRDVGYLTILGICGQYFIFYTINHFGPLTLSTVTTTRKFFTVLASIIIFGHNVSFVQWISIALVFCGVGLEMWMKIKEKREKKGERKKE